MRHRATFVRLTPADLYPAAASAEQGHRLEAIHEAPAPHQLLPFGRSLDFLVLRDRSNERRAERLLLQSQKLESVGVLAAGVAHEVRNPLSSIKGYATYFASLFAEDSEKKKEERC